MIDQPFRRRTRREAISAKNLSQVSCRRSPFKLWWLHLKPHHLHHSPHLPNLIKRIQPRRNLGTVLAFAPPSFSARPRFGRTLGRPRIWGSRLVLVSLARHAYSLKLFECIE